VTLEEELAQVKNELAFYKRREADICKAVGGVSDGGHYRNDIIEHLEMLMKTAAEVEAARAAVRGVTKIRLMLESTEKQRKRLGQVLLQLAPLVAALGRAPNVSPENRKELLLVEPVMLEVLQTWKETKVP
jgi:hypothetical protein